MYSFRVLSILDSIFIEKMRQIMPEKRQESCFLHKFFKTPFFNLSTKSHKGQICRDYKMRISESNTFLKPQSVISLPPTPQHTIIKKQGKIRNRPERALTRFLYISHLLIRYKYRDTRCHRAVFWYNQYRQYAPWKQAAS